MLRLLRRINEETGVTIIVITHSMQVVHDICKNVAVLVEGKVVEKGSVSEVFANPRHEVTRQLLGRESWDE